MATIELFAAKINMMPSLIGEAKKAVLDYKTELEAIRTKALAIDASALDLSDIIASVKASTEILDRKADSLDALNGRVEQFISDVVRIDQGVAELIRLRKKEFYDAHPNLKPESEKSRWEKICDGLATVGQWCKEHWKLIVTILIVIAAIVVIVFFPAAAPFLLLAAKGAIMGAVTGGLMGGLSSLAAGGSFWEGFENGAFTGAVTGLFFGGLGGAGQMLGGSCRVLEALGGVAKAIPYIAKATSAVSLGMGGFDLLSWGLGLAFPDNALTALNHTLHQSDLYNGFQFAVSAVAAFTTGFSQGMKNPSCFVAGTLVLTATGLVAIESVKAGDMVVSTDPGTMEAANKRVLETYVREVSRLVHLTVAGGLISTTVDHPFYVRGRGFANAGELMVGDELVNADGSAYPVERAYHETTDKPVTVYNFQVEDFHTYHVGESGILVHNADYQKQVEQLEANRKQGDAFEKEVGTKLKETQSDVVKQITVKTESGTRTRLDFVGKEGETIILTEAKSSATAPLTVNQSNGFPEIAKSGATVVGKGKPPFTGGTVIPPTEVTIVRP